MFFYANRAISVDEADFWEKSYLLRLSKSWKLDARPSSTLVSESRHAHITTEEREMSEKESISLSSSMKGKEWSDGDLQVCPLFIKGMAKSIVSAGKSWQLIRHVPSAFAAVAGKNKDNEFDGLGNYKGGADLSKFHRGQSIAGLTLSEIFCVSLAGLIGPGDHISKYFWQNDRRKSKFVPSPVSDMNEQIMGNGNDETVAALTSSGKMWYKFLVDTLLQKRVNDMVTSDIPNMKGEDMAGDIDEFPLPVQKSFCPENPVLTVCRKLLNKNNDAQKALNLSRNYYLPPLNDEILRNALLVGEGDNFSGVKGTNHAFGFRFGESEYRRSQYDSKLLEVLFPFPTLLPSFQVQLYQ